MCKLSVLNSRNPDSGYVDEGIDEAIKLLEDSKRKAIAVATIVVYEDGDRQYSYTAARNNGKAALIGRLHWFIGLITKELG